jgi:hypothetical protein
MNRSVSGLLCLLSCSLFVSLTQAQTTDARDYEGAGGTPDHTLAFTTYLRHTDTHGTQSRTVNSASFRAGYLKKLGKHVSLVPLDFAVSAADVDLRLYPGTPAKGQTSAAPTPTPHGPASVATIHGTGYLDLMYLPTVIFDLVEDSTNATHSYLGLSALITMPTGSYDRDAAINVGENRWTIKPQLILGQRLWKVLTLEAVGNATIYTDNNNVAAHPDAKTTVTVSSAQKPTYGAEAHVAVDLHETMYVSASYYVTSLGEKYTAAAVLEPSAVVQTARFNFGIRVEQQTILYLQLQQDLKVTGEEPNARYVGARVSHFFW